jgi:hypothetical protein
MPNEGRPSGAEVTVSEPVAAEQLPRVDRDEEGRPQFSHVCINVPVHRTTLLLSQENGWWWQDENTLMPSIHCHRCDTHGWWRNGVWEPV